MREAADIRVASPMNLFISNGQCLVITRFVYDFGGYGKELTPAHLQYKSLWYTYGSKYLTKDQRHTMQVGTPKALIVASEPLTTDTTRWVEVPEYSIITASRHAKNHKLTWLMDDIALRAGQTKGHLWQAYKCPLSNFNCNPLILNYNYCF